MSRYNINYTGEQIDDCLERFFNSLNTVIVSASSGSNVIMSKGTTILTATEEDEKWIFHPLEFGVWTITADNGLTINSTTLNIDCIKVYLVNF